MPMAISGGSNEARKIARATAVAHHLPVLDLSGSGAYGRNGIEVIREPLKHTPFILTSSPA